MLHLEIITCNKFSILYISPEFGLKINEFSLFFFMENNLNKKRIRFKDYFSLDFASNFFLVR